MRAPPARLTVSGALTTLYVWLVRTPNICKTTHVLHAAMPCQDALLALIILLASLVIQLPIGNLTPIQIHTNACARVNMSMTITHVYYAHRNLLIAMSAKMLTLAKLARIRTISILNLMGKENAFACRDGP